MSDNIGHPGTREAHANKYKIILDSPIIVSYDIGIANKERNMRDLVSVVVIVIVVYMAMCFGLAHYSGL